MRRKFKTFLHDISNDHSWFTVANFLTLLRIILIPFIVYGIIHAKWLYVFILFFTATITDLLDGYLARKLNQYTKLGAYLDPIADKLFLFSSFTALAFVQSPSFTVPGWFVFLLFFRELTMLVGMVVMELLHIKYEIKPTIWGKLTTLFQSTFIFWIFICYFFSWNPIKTYSVTIVLLALFSVFSLGHYTMIGIRYIKR